MRILRIGRLVLIVSFLLVGLSHAQTLEEYYNKGVEYGAQGKFEEADKEFKKALEVDRFFTPAKVSLKLIEDTLEKRLEDEVTIHLFKTTLYENKGMFDDAIAECKKAIAINPNFAEAHYNLGVVYGDKGMLNEEIAEYEKAIAINPNLAEAHSDLGVAYRDKGMFDKEIAEYEKAIAINPNLAKAHSNLGVVYGSTGMLDDAIAEYEKAIAINPNLAEAHNNLAVAYYSKKQYDLAIEHCDKAVQLGYRVHPEFLQELRRVSGKDR
ncbi:MAG: tetratricopeptide repeat protein [Candidatus Omnitrophota bacterium]